MIPATRAIRCIPPKIVISVKKVRMMAGPNWPVYLVKSDCDGIGLDGIEDQAESDDNNEGEKQGQAFLF